METIIQDDILNKILNESIEKKQIILYNDHINPMDHVIESLVKICRHSPSQAEQCTMIAHFNNKVSVKNGSYQQLEPICTRLSEAGLTVEIQ